MNLIQEMNKTSVKMEPVTVPNNVETAQIAQTYNEILVRLKHMDESRQEFVSNVSHELKTPITSIRVLADTLLSMGDAPPEMYRDFLSDISREIDREGTIIEDLLAMVRLEQTGAELEVTPININELLERVLKRLRPIAAEREIEVYLESFRPVIADVDEVKLERAFTNLVENAIKYNNDGGWVRVSLNADHNYFYVKIVDNGVGIPEDAVDKIFERFYRVDKARSRNTGGTGLGLSITRTIIRLHHGVVKVHSEYGSGTTFHIRIPLNYIG
jgi:signal transduction histidine kinase